MKTNAEIANSFKIRCSEIGSIMGYKDKDVVPKGAETYLKKWLIARTHNESLPFVNKYITKGIRTEKESIELISDVLPEFPFLVQNDKRFSNEFIEGFPDVVSPDGNHVIDIKNSFTAETFPFYDVEIPDSGYEWQLIGYSAITGAKNAHLIYTLNNASPDEIQREAERYSFNLGQELTEDILKMFTRLMTYDHLPKEKRLKKFTFTPNPDDVNLIEKRVLKCREYLFNILEKCTR